MPVSLVWNSSPKRVLRVPGNSSELNLVQDWSIAPSIFSLLSWEVSSEAFPTRQIVRWIKLSTSVAGTAMPGSSFAPASSKSCHAAVSGRKMARIAACIFVDSVSLSLGKFFPKNSDIYLSTFGTRQTSRSGRGCSLKRASLSSFDRQRFTCFDRYDEIGLGTGRVPSLCLTSSAGSNTSPTSDSWSDSREEETETVFCRFSLGWVAPCSPLLCVSLEEGLSSR